MASRKNKRPTCEVIVLKHGYCFRGVDAGPGDKVKVLTTETNWYDYHEIAVLPKHYKQDKKYYDRLIKEAKEAKAAEDEFMRSRAFDPLAPENLGGEPAPAVPAVDDADKPDEPVPDLPADEAAK